MMSVDEKLASIRWRTFNIRRYRRLLETELTDLERKFVMKRLSEEHEALSELSTAMFPLRLGPRSQNVLAASL